MREAAESTWVRLPGRGVITGLPTFNHVVWEMLHERGGGQPRAGIYVEQSYPRGPIWMTTVPSRWPAWFSTPMTRKPGPRVHQTRRYYLRREGAGTREQHLWIGDWEGFAQGWCGITIRDPIVYADLGDAQGCRPCAVCVERVRPV